MRILIYGAGILGSLYGYLLQKAGKDVTLLARNPTYEQIKQNGIDVYLKQQNKQVNFHIPVVSELNPAEKYDLIMIVMQKNHIYTILPILHDYPHETIFLFLGNNGTVLEEYCPPLSPDQCVLGFPAAGGIRRENYMEINYYETSPITIGEISGNQTPRLKQIQAFFAEAQIPVVICENIDAWLKYHIALVSPLANALHGVECNNYELANDKKLLKTTVRAIKEGFTVLEALGYPILPKKIKLFKTIPTFILTPLLKKRLNSEFAEIALAGHAKYAKNEMIQIAKEFQTIKSQASIETPHIDELYQILLTSHS